MCLIRVSFVLVVSVSLAACDLIEKNVGIDLQEIFEEGIASFDEPFGRDSTEDGSADKAVDQTYIFSASREATRNTQT